MARPAHRTTSERKRFVKKLASLMLKPQEIASIIGISAKTLERRYQKELDAGMAEIHASVITKLLKQITSDDKSMSTAHQRVWFLNRYHPAEVNDPGQPIRALVTVNLPDNGRSHPDFLAQNHALHQRRAPKLVQIEGKTVE
jgi:hypothetical protein